MPTRYCNITKLYHFHYWHRELLMDVLNLVTVLYLASLVLQVQIPGIENCRCCEVLLKWDFNIFQINTRRRSTKNTETRRNRTQEKANILEINILSQKTVQRIFQKLINLVLMTIVKLQKIGQKLLRQHRQSLDQQVIISAESTYIILYVI